MIAGGDQRLTRPPLLFTPNTQAMTAPAIKKTLLLLFVSVLSLSLATQQAAAQAGSIEGRVVSTESNRPISDVNVGLEGTTRGAATDVSGHFTIENVGPGRYTLVASFVGYEPARRRIRIRAGQATSLTIQLSRSAALLSEVTVVGESEQVDYNAEVSTSALKVPTPIIKIPQAVNVIPGAVIEDQAAEEMRDVVRNVSGIQEDGTFGNSTDNFTIRGFDSRNAILRDGYTTVSNRTLNANIERVEVLKGPASLLYGRFEPGGLINVITKKPRFVLSGEGRGFFSSQGAQLFQLDLTGPLAQNTAVGNLAFRVVGEQENSDYWRNFGERNRTFLAPSLALDYGTGDVTLQYEFLDSRQPFDRGRIFFDGEPLDTPPERRFGEDWERLEETIHLGSVLLDQKLSKAWQLSFKGAYQDVTGFDRQARPRSLTLDENGNPTGELIRRTDGSSDRFDRRYYASLNVTGEEELLGWTHTLLAGIDYEDSEGGRDVFIVGPDQGGFNIFDPTYGLLEESSAEPIEPSDFTNTFTTFGVYIQNSVDFSEQWTAVIGGRFEDYENFQQSNFGEISPPSDDSEGNTFLPRLGLVYRPLTNLSFYASYSESFQPNSVPVLPESNEPIGEIDPQEGISYEIGAKAQLFTGLNLTLALFDIERQNVVNVSLDENNDLVFNVSDEVTSRGVELDLTGIITPNWNIIAAYSYIDASDPDSPLRDEVQNVAEHSGSVSSTYRLTEGLLSGLEFGGGVYFVGERFGGGTAGATTQLQEPFFLDGYTKVDLHASYTFPVPAGDSQVRAQVNLRNVFDEEYFPSATSALRVRPGEVRALFGSIAWEF